MLTRVFLAEPDALRRDGRFFDEDGVKTPPLLVSSSSVSDEEYGNLVFCFRRGGWTTSLSLPSLSTEEAVDFFFDDLNGDLRLDEDPGVFFCSLRACILALHSCLSS
jgi:hypothetical protein